MVKPQDNSIVVTIDVDWANDEVLEETLNWFLQQNVKLTVFATHSTSVLQGLDPGQVEIGVHPNLLSIPMNDYGAIQSAVERLLEMYPNAVGVRCHSLVQSTRLLDVLARLGFRYEANVFLPYQTGIKPFRLWNGLIRIPHFYEDDLRCAYGRSFDVSSLPLEQPGLKVFDFHPIHIYLNTDSLERYEAAKPYQNLPKELAPFRNHNQGTKTLAEELLKYITQNSHQTHTMREIADAT